MLRTAGYIDLKESEARGFDHADVCLTTGQVFVAHTAANRVDMFDGAALAYTRSIPGSPHGSGVLYCPEAGWILAAARGAGKLLVLDAGTGDVLRVAAVGPKPNGIAWDPVRQRALVADVETRDARCVNPATGGTLAVTPLPGRPRWCVYDAARDCFWINIMEPHVVQGLSAADFSLTAALCAGGRGPHGLALDRAGGRLFVACDDARLVAVGADSGSILAETALAGPPDAIWLNERRGLLYICVGEPGCVQVMDTAAYAVVDCVETESGAHTLAFDEARQRLYVFLPETVRAAAYEETGGVDADGVRRAVGPAGVRSANGSASA